MKLVLFTATMSPEFPYPGEIQSWIDTAKGFIQYAYQSNTPDRNLGVVGSYENLYRRPIDADILVYTHDDVIMREEGWDERIKREFTDQSVGVVGMGGGLAHGASDMYRTPYRLNQLGRSGYLSAVDDAEVHGQRFTGETDVAVLDGFCIAIRRRLLDRMGGWTTHAGPIDFFCYDYLASCLARRYGYRTRVVGVRCHHLGGVTSVKVKGLSITSQKAYDESHRYLYENFSDVLPWSCI